MGNIFVKRYQKPTQIVKTVHDISFKELIDSGVRVVAFDVDNTLTVYGEKLLDIKTRDLFLDLKRKGLDVVLASNSLDDRKMILEQFNGRLHRPNFLIHRKPSATYFKGLLLMVGCSPEEILMVGDKYFFDVNPSLRLGMKSILVKPLGKDLLLDKIFAVRFWEKVVLKSLGLKRPQ